MKTRVESERRSGDETPDRLMRTLPLNCCGAHALRELQLLRSADDIFVAVDSFCMASFGAVKRDVQKTITPIIRQPPLFSRIELPSANQRFHS